MELTYRGLWDRASWKTVNVRLPNYDPAALAEKTKGDPAWVHFGAGNIFRVFLGGIADDLIEGGALDRGIVCVEPFDYEVIEKAYAPHDNLTLAVTLQADGGMEKRVLGSLSEGLCARPDEPAAWERLQKIFRAPGLQLVSFTITEKGYALRGAGGEYLPAVRADLDHGPAGPVTAMGVVTAMLYERWKVGGAPLALVSMDNVSQNGRRLRESVLEVAAVWADKGYVEPGFLSYVRDENTVSFPWTMIDKITPRPGEAVAAALARDGVEGMDITVTDRHTYIAPFVNAEKPQYLVVEDAFPNGRPPFEQAGVYMTDRETVNRSERMKVTVCLNPIHTALCTFACMLGYDLFADGMGDPELAELARQVGYREGLPVVEGPGILSPKDFLDEVLTVRFPNPYLGDTSARIAVDISQMVGIRFGETIKAYIARDGDAKALTAIPLAIAGWLRYLLAVDDQGRFMDLSPDPMGPKLTAMLADVTLGQPESLKNQLRPILSNENIFGVDLYQAGIGEKIEAMVREMLVGPGAVRATLKKHLATGA